MKSKQKLIALSLASALSLGASSAATAAVTEVEGSGGGGIVPWALVSGGKPTVSTTWVNTGDYSLAGFAVNGSIGKNLELSFGHMDFDTAGVGLGHLKVNVIGAKYMFLPMSGSTPALAVGIQYKKADDGSTGFYNSIGADDSGTDIYLAATKVLPMGGKNVLLNGTIRATKGNQTGILGFGTSTEDGYNFTFEGSAGVFLNKSTVLGVEYRTKPDNITGLKEDNWADVFFAYFPNKNLSLVAAYADLGDVAAEANPGAAGKDQRGLYLQIQANF